MTLRVNDGLEPESLTLSALLKWSVQASDAMREYSRAFQKLQLRRTGTHQATVDSGVPAPLPFREAGRTVYL